ncbi:MAG: hypothetical protein QM831_44945 [Kofleriaceae bacterium]
MQGMQTFWVVFLIMIGIGYVVAFSRRGRTSMAMPGRNQTLHHPASPDEVFNALKKIPPPFKVDDADPGTKIVVLSSPVTFFSWGFLYPVFITPNGAGGSQITVGCTSKLIQMGPIVTNAHNKAVAAVERTLSIAAARVVS